MAAPRKSPWHWGYASTMNTASYELIAANSTVNAVSAFIGGLVIAGALVWAVRLGIKVRRQESAPPTPTSSPGCPRPGRSTKSARCGNPTRYRSPRTRASG